MKKLSELIDFTFSQHPVQKAVNDNEPIMEGASFKVVGNRERVETILNKEDVLNPVLFVKDNPRMKKSAESIISLLNKKCKWNAYYFPIIQSINGMDTCIIGSGIDDGAVSFTPMGNYTSATIRYYRNYEFESSKQHAEYVISAKNMGIVKLIGFVIDIINNPDLYSHGMYEALNIDVRDYASVAQAYSKIESNNTKRYNEIKRCVETGDTHNMTGGVTQKGFNDLKKIVSESPTPIDPIHMLIHILTKTAEGNKYRDILCEYQNKRMSNEGYVAVIHLLFADPDVGLSINIERNTNVDVSESNGLQKSLKGVYEYKGVDVSFVPLLGMRMEDFIEAADLYFDALEDLKRSIEEMVEYSRMTRLQKLENIRIGQPMIFISGVGGIGKSETWEIVKDEMKLVENKDYAERGNQSCSASELYRFIYDNNGRVLVFDDTPELFDGSFKLSFWKTATEPKRGKFPKIGAPKGDADKDTGPTTAKFYSRKDCEEGGIINYKKMYFKECPQQLNKAVQTGTRWNYNNANTKQTEYDETKLRTRKGAMPDKMDIMSRFIVMTNISEEEFERTLKQHWGAIRTRSEFYEMAPPRSVIWAKIKMALLKDKADGNDNGLIPLAFIDDVITFVEGEIAKKTATELTWRAFTSGSLQSAMRKGGNWKRVLLRSITKQRNKKIDLLF